MKPTIYIETTIPSYYFNSRTDAESKILSQWTREWWDKWREGYQVVSSFAVIEELRRGKHPFQAEKLAMIESLPLLEITRRETDIADTYIAHKAMPADPRGDALAFGARVRRQMRYAFELELSAYCEPAEGATHRNVEHADAPAYSAFVHAV